MIYRITVEKSQGKECGRNTMEEERGEAPEELVLGPSVQESEKGAKGQWYVVACCFLCCINYNLFWLYKKWLKHSRS